MYVGPDAHRASAPHASSVKNLHIVAQSGKHKTNTSLVAEEENRAWSSPNRFASTGA